MVYAEGDFTKAEKSRQVTNAAKAANEILLRYGLQPMSDTEIEAEIQRGREMAKMDPVELIANILTSEELEWWDRFSWEARVHDANKVYKKHCQLYGMPSKGGMLSNLLDVALSSAEFWGNYREKDIPTYQNQYVPMTKSWRSVLRFVVAVAVDGTSGAIASGGGAVASGVIGGLCSHGADDLLFGDG